MTEKAYVGGWRGEGLVHVSRINKKSFGDDSEMRCEEIT